MVDINQDTSLGWIPMSVAAVMVRKSEKTLMRWTKRSVNRLECFHYGKTPHTTRAALERVRVFTNGQAAATQANPAHEAAMRYLREVCGLKD